MYGTARQERLGRVSIGKVLSGMERPEWLGTDVTGSQRWVLVWQEGHGVDRK